MGMSASQARLLSITGRLTDNELRSQIITNSKLRLATESTKASNEYANALNSQQLMYMTYDDTGAATKVALTPAVLYDYAPLKNQYILRNASNKIFISNVDAVNFTETDTLHDFLDRYGLLVDLEEGQVRTTVENPDYGSWLKEEPLQENYKRKVTKYREIETEIINPEWEDYWEREPEITDDKYLVEAGVPGYHVYKWETTDSGEGTSLYKTFRDASKSCHNNAVNHQRTGCYIHVLSHMLDLELGTGSDGASANKSSYPKSFTTSLGGTAIVRADEIDYSQICDDGKTPYMLPISDYIREGYDFNGQHLQLKAAEHLGGEPYKDDNNNDAYFPATVDDILTPNGLPVDTSTNAGKVKALLSNYTNESTPQLKTLRQKCIDMLYVMQNYMQLGVDYKNFMIPYIYSFEQDMRLALENLNIVDNGYDVPSKDPVYDEQSFNDDHDAWEKEGEPEKYIEGIDYEPYEEEVDDVETWKKKHEEWQSKEPEKYITDYESYISDAIVNDKLKAQWYTNLWHALNGSESANPVRNEQLKSSWNTGNPEYGFKVKDLDKSVQTDMFEVLDSNLFNSSEWLQFALEHGIITMQQAQFYDPTQDSLKVLEKASNGYEWNSISYKSSPDFVQQSNEKKIAIAEVKYNKTMHDIQIKDKKYDTDLKKLDTQHNALQTEYESVKEMLSKNVDRSFKAFS